MRPAVSWPLLASALMLPAGSASAQPDERRLPIGGSMEATIYRNANFQGPAVTLSQADPDVRLAWPVYSIKVVRGAWQLCSEPDYRGTCVTFTQNRPLVSGLGNGNRVRSIRPLGGDPYPPGSGGGGGGGIGNPGASLRGMAAEFFPRPMDGRDRILACARGSATATCAARTADQFCRDRGWTGSAREAMETENRRAYLADVLCTRTGR